MPCTTAHWARRGSTPSRGLRRNVTNPIGSSWIGLVFGLGFVLSFGAGTLAAAITWIGYKAGWFNFGSDLSESMWGAGAAFVVDAIVTVAISLRTRPKPVSELQGLVYGMANEDEFAARRRHRWWESPKLLGGTVLAGATILTIIFW